MHATSKKSPLVWVVHISVVALVALWLFPTVGLFVSSFRTADQIANSGWWASLFTQERQAPAIRIEGAEEQVDGEFVITGNLFEAGNVTISRWGTSSREPEAYEPDQVVDLGDGEMPHGCRPMARSGCRHRRASETPACRVCSPRPQGRPNSRLENYRFVLFDPSNREGMAKAFFNTLTVTIPATVIPIVIAAFAAYALAWMQFPGRSLLIAAVVGLLVVPLQLALIPLLKLHNDIGIGKGYLGVWLAHTGFGLPLAIYLLRNYMVGLPRDIIENARVDGATDFQIFVKIILPLSFPALASFAIFQFLWTWNDLLVALVFLIDATGETTVMTKQIVELLGTRGGNWEILATSAFVSIAVPLVVFFAMQKYLVRGLLAGSVK
jgi:alpha-glucoside transport system permease protein